MIQIMLEDILIPIFICVVLPVTIVWLVTRARQNEINRRTEVMLKAIENGQEIDPNLFNNVRKNPKSVKQELLEKFNGACITSLMGVAFLVMSLVPGINIGDFQSLMVPAGFVMIAVGIGLFISYFTGKKMLAAEIDAEEKNLYQK
ncbi:MAG: hypothetical protein IK052_01245 [Bacteroidales bacterium]|nr:hypothetical protein [Bacteroidales bacterium]